MEIPAHSIDRKYDIQVSAITAWRPMMEQRVEMKFLVTESVKSGEIYS